MDSQRIVKKNSQRIVNKTTHTDEKDSKRKKKIMMVNGTNKTKNIERALNIFVYLYCLAGYLVYDLFRYSHTIYAINNFRRAILASLK